MKKQNQYQPVNSARIVATILLGGLVVAYMQFRKETDIGSAFGTFYAGVLIAIFVIIWIIIEIRRKLKKR